MIPAYTMRFRSFVAITALFILLSSCRSTAPTATMQLTEAPVGFSIIDDSLGVDPEIEAMILPYRERLNMAINEVIGEAAGLLEKSDPESALGNMAADAMLKAANKLSSTPVDMALTNNGGLRVSIAPGPITVGEIFELMPFENMLAVLDLTGAQIDSLANQIAAVGGEPIAGFSFKIDENTASVSDIKVNNTPLNPSKTYRLVTSDYLANGGSRMAALWQPVKREDLNMLLRDSFIEHIREIGTVGTEIEGRISIVNQ